MPDSGDMAVFQARWRVGLWAYGIAELVQVVYVGQIPAGLSLLPDSEPLKTTTNLPKCRFVLEAPAHDGSRVRCRLCGMLAPGRGHATA